MYTNIDRSSVFRLFYEAEEVETILSSKLVSMEYIYIEGGNKFTRPPPPTPRPPLAHLHEADP